MSTEALERLQEMLDAAQARATQPKSSVVPPEVALDPRLHNYQLQAVRHLRSNPRAGLFLEMGLGKTAITLQALTPDHLPVLVVAPKRVAERVWPVEVPKWRPDLSVSVAAGTPAKRRAALEVGADITVIGRDNIGDIYPGQFRTVVLDELSGFKGRGARWKAARQITVDATYVWGLTGTPSPNGYMDLWSQLFLIDSGQRLGNTLGSSDPRHWKNGSFESSFRNRFFSVARTHRQTGVVIDWELKSGARQQIEQAISDICLSMKAIDYLDLPEVTYNEVLVPIEPATRKVYNQMLSTLVAQVDDGTVAAANAGVMTSKLSQITAGFLYGDEAEGEPTIELHHNKIKAAVEVVQGIGSPVLVFYRFVWEREALLAAMKAEGIGVRTIDEPGVAQAWDRGEVEVLLTHPGSAGHGLNLQYGGHTVLWVSREWSLELWDQGNGRVNRQGQEHPVMIHYLVSPSLVDGKFTVDEAITDRLVGKASVQDALMAALRRA